MKVIKTIAIVTIGVGAGMVIANKLTDGAVMDAVTNLYHNIVDKSEDAIDAVADTAENVADAASSIVEG